MKQIHAAATPATQNLVQLIQQACPQNTVFSEQTGAKNMDTILISADYGGQLSAMYARINVDYANQCMSASIRDLYTNTVYEERKIKTPNQLQRFLSSVAKTV